MAVPITSKKNKVKKLQEAVNKLKQDFLESQDQNEELKNNVSTLNTDFIELQAENEELKNNFSAFNNDLSINAGKIELLENNQGKLISRVFGLRIKKIGKVLGVCSVKLVSLNSCLVQSDQFWVKFSSLGCLGSSG